MMTSKALKLFIAVILVVCELFYLPLGIDEGGSTHSLAESHTYTANGIIHVHSKFSDGSGTVQEIAQSAKRAKRDFVILTDHNRALDLREFEKSYDGTDIFIELEASTGDGHLISFFSHTPLKTLPDQKIVAASVEHFMNAGAFPEMKTFLAHPSNLKNPWTRFDRTTDGMEVVNFDSTWQQEASTRFFSFLSTCLILPWNQYLAAIRFFHVDPRDLSSWDTMNIQKTNRVGYLAHDTHAKLKFSNNHEIYWPDYDVTFRLATNVVFLSAPLELDFEKRKQQIYQSLFQARLAMVFDLIHPFMGNSFEIVCKDKSYRSGEHLKIEPGCHISIKRPKHFPYAMQLRLLENGKVIHESSLDEPQFDFQGIRSESFYRAEIYAKIKYPFRLLSSRLVPYIIYNPIFVD